MRSLLVKNFSIILVDGRSVGGEREATIVHNLSFVVENPNFYNPMEDLHIHNRLEHFRDTKSPTLDGLRDIRVR